MHKKVEVHLDGLLSLLSLLLIDWLATPACDCVGLQWMLVVDIAVLVAILAQVVLLALGAAPLLAHQNVRPTIVACVHESWRGGVVHVVQHHHRAVFCPTQFVELIMVPLAQG